MNSCLFDQAGPATIAYDGAYDFYAVKKVKLHPGMEKSKVKTFDNVSSLISGQDVYQKDEGTKIAYECMDVSLQHILVTPRGHLTSLLKSQ